MYDIIIIGAGTAGISCAITAAQRKRKVLVVEKDNRIGGTLHLSAGHMSGGGTRLQKQKGIDDHPQKHFDDVMRINKGSADAWMIQLATNEAPHTLDWLDDLGMEWADNSPAFVYGHVPYLTPRTHFGNIIGGQAILKVLEPEFQKQVKNGQIDLLLNHTLIDLVLENQRVTGVLTENTEGGKKTFVGKHTVLTTGGYAANPQFFAEKHPEKSRLISTASPNSQGEGIVVAVQHGAVFHNAEKALSTNGGIELDPLSGRADFWGIWAQVSNTAVRRAYELYVDDDGNRFMNEDEYSPDVRERAVENLPNRRFWVIFDEKTRQNVPFLFLWITPEQFLEEVKKEKAMWCADSLENLADKTGLPKDNLIKTIKRYNDMIFNQHDPNFGRQFLTATIEQPPFYAVLTYAMNLITFGGIKVNQNLQVMHQNGKPIEGLYAAGEILGAGATSGNAFCGGMLLTPALSFGRILGRTL
jgi:fumarate reductase flavoprotein subunit